MKTKFTRRSRPNIPTKPLAIRGLMREIAENIGFQDTDGFSPEKFLVQYNQHFKNDASYSKNDHAPDFLTIRRWWIGESFPDSTGEKSLFAPVKNLVEKWLDRYNHRDRLQRYLASADLRWIKHEQGDKENAENLANMLIRTIHEDWRLKENYFFKDGSTSQIAPRGPFKENIGNPYYPTTFFMTLHPEIDSKNVTFDTALEYPAYIYPPVHLRGKNFHELDRPASIISHLLWIAINLKPSGPKIHLALILDLLTVANAIEALEYFKIKTTPSDSLDLIGLRAKTELEQRTSAVLTFFTNRLRELDCDQHGPCWLEDKSIYCLHEEFEFQIENVMGRKLPPDAYFNLFHLKRVFLSHLSKKFDLPYIELLDSINQWQQFVFKETIELSTKVDGSDFLDRYKLSPEEPG